MALTSSGDAYFVRRLLWICAAVAGLGLAGWFIWTSIHGLLLIFTAVVLAIGLDGLARLLYRAVPLSRRLSVAVTAFLIVAALGGFLLFATMNVAAKAPRLGQDLSQSVNRLSTELRGMGVSTPWSNGETPSASGGGASLGQRLASDLSSAATLTVSTLADAFVVAIIGFYLAFQPALYHNALIRLWPPARRPRVEALISEIGEVIRRWLVGRSLSMAAVGLGSALGVWALGLPFPLLLGLIAGLLTFIPYLGAIISAVPALLVAVLHGFDVAFYVVALYLGLHIVEGYVLSPLIQKRAVSLAPGFLLIAQVLGIAVAGVFGMMLAAPIALTGEIVVQVLYIQDVIGDEAHVPA